MPNIIEFNRLEEADRRIKDWKLWGCYVAERAWGTVREDYSRDGSAWEYFPFEHSHLKAYRWNEDGIAGICDRRQNLCFAPSFWNENDDIIKERLFGLGGNQGNHGEDVKEYYFYLDNTPTHSYMKFLYKYPQRKFPYELLREENARRDKTQPEYELLDTGIFDQDEYFDIFIEYAKADFDDICVKITAFNRAARRAALHVLPTVWFRNTWSWDASQPKPEIREEKHRDLRLLNIKKQDFGDCRMFVAGGGRFLFCDNESNYRKLYDAENDSNFTKDGIGEFVVNGDESAVNRKNTGTKAAYHEILEIEPGESQSVCIRLCSGRFAVDEIFDSRQSFIEDCESVFQKRIAEADAFYDSLAPGSLDADARRVMRQALAGMLWSKQFYHYSVRDWLEGDPAFSPPPAERHRGRNSDWKHLYNDEVLSMPDKWEYPWYAAWDLAFHAIPLALLDADFAKRQLLLLLREWYMHPNGQIPAYEWQFSDVNPPVHAWAALRVYRIEAKRKGSGDRIFLEKVFHKLLLNFTWWVNRKDEEGNNVFEGGFLGLDNIGIFDRSKDLPTGGHLEQSDGTSWMAMFCLNMLAIALELAREDKAYEDVASKFFEHFVYISDAMNRLGDENTKLWDEHDGFYYDVLHLPHSPNIPLRIRSIVGLIPLFAVETIEDRWLDDLPDFKKRTEWFLKNRPDLTRDISCLQRQGREGRRLLSIVNEERLRSILRYMLSEDEFLSAYGIRSLSKFHKECPYFLFFEGNEYRIDYEPAESCSGLFGGNSNWRGPVWFPINFLLIESLQKFDYYFGEDFRSEFPAGSGETLTLWQISQELEKRLANIFLRSEEGIRPVYGASGKFHTDPHWKNRILFYEYFHGEDGRGLGASHQTGWTGLIGKILQQLGEYAYDTGPEQAEDIETTIRFRYTPKKNAS